MKIVNKTYNNWTPIMRKHLRNLTFKEGLMRNIVSTYPCDTFVAFENDLIIGWGIFILNKRITNNDFMLYIRKSYRRKGIGKKIVKSAIKKYGKISIYIWDNISSKFFCKMINETNAVFVSSGKCWIRSL